MRWIVPMALAFVVATPAAGKAGTPIGYVKKIDGTVVLTRAGESGLVAVGTAIEEGDVIESCGESAVGFTLRDGTTLSTGNETVVAIENYAYSGDASTVGLSLHVSEGILEMITGGIAAMAPGSVAITTPNGTVGLEGTHLAVKVEPDDDAESACEGIPPHEHWHVEG